MSEINEYDIPVKYLKRFTLDSDEYSINVFDFDKLTEFVSCIDEAERKDINKQDGDPDEIVGYDINKFLDENFGDFDQAIDFMIEKKRVPKRDEVGVDIFFQISLLMAKNMTDRDHFQNIISKKISRLIMENGPIEESSPELQKLLFNEADSSDFHIINTVAVAMYSFYDLVSSRKWMLLEAPEGMGFVTSDNPVSICLIDRMPYIGESVRLDDYTSRIIFPLSHKMCLVGVFGEGLPKCHLASDKQVAVMNTTCLFDHRRQAFYPKGNFKWLYNGKIQERKDFLNALLERGDRALKLYHAEKEKYNHQEFDRSFLDVFDPELLKKR